MVEGHDGRRYEGKRSRDPQKPVHSVRDVTKREENKGEQDE